MCIYDWPGGSSRTGGAGGPLHGRGRQSPLYLRFQGELILHGGFQHAADALRSGQHIADRAFDSGQSPQNILQFLSLCIEDTAPSELLHGNRGENLIDCVDPLNRRINLGKTGQRHKSRISFRFVKRAFKAHPARRQGKGALSAAAVPGITLCAYPPGCSAGTKPPPLS